MIFDNLIKQIIHIKFKKDITISDRDCTLLESNNYGIWVKGPNRNHFYPYNNIEYISTYNS